jgi:hypothetical protein
MPFDIFAEFLMGSGAKETLTVSILLLRQIPLVSSEWGLLEYRTWNYFT